MKKYLDIEPLVGKITIIVGKDEDEEIGEVVLCGDPQGLESLGKVLISLSKIDQQKNIDLPQNESEHIHLDYGVHIGKNTLSQYNLILSRLDTKSGVVKNYYDHSVNDIRNIKELRNIQEEDI